MYLLAIAFEVFRQMAGLGFINGAPCRLGVYKWLVVKYAGAFKGGIFLPRGRLLATLGKRIARESKLYRLRNAIYFL